MVYNVYAASRVCDEDGREEVAGGLEECLPDYQFAFEGTQRGVWENKRFSFGVLLCFLFSL